MKKILVHFDLENTLINHWTNRSLCHVDNITEILASIKYSNQPTVYGVFSYALWCESNIAEFKNSDMRNSIEKQYDISIDDSYILNVEDMCKYSVQQHHQSKGLTVNQYWSFYPKHHAFLDMCLSMPDDTFDRYILIDDTVQNGLTMCINDKNIEFYNPT